MKAFIFVAYEDCGYGLIDQSKKMSPVLILLGTDSWIGGQAHFPTWNVSISQPENENPQSANLSGYGVFVV